MGDEAPVEGAAPAEVALDTAPVEGAEGAPAEGEAAPVVEKTAEEIAAEAEAKATEDAKFLADLPALIAKIPEDEQRKIALKFANRTMAAARRAERATEAVTRENHSLKAQLQQAASGPSLRDKPMDAIKAAGFSTVREFIDHMITSGAAKERTPADEVAELRREREEEKLENARRETAAAIRDSQSRVADAIKADATRWGRTGTPTGQSRLWGEIVAYHKEHGACPTEAVYFLADAVEQELRAEFGDPAPRPAAKDATAPGTGAAGARIGAKAATMTNKGGAGAPVVREYSQDPEIRKAQVNADMLAAGELSRGAAQG